MIDPMSWKSEMPVFREAAAKYYAGEFPRNTYKGTSGRFGSYAQKADGVSMLRLRMTAGRVTKTKLNYIADAIEKFDVKRAHFTTCEAIQLHDLAYEPLCEIMEGALEAGIVTMGGGGDFPRNVMCSPLSGVEKGEYFNVMPWALGAGEWLMHIVNMEKMPRKLKVCFSNSPANIPHATYRDMGFVAREDGLFDVYSAGGVGPNWKLGVKVAEAVKPAEIGPYLKAMYLTFCAYGNYENRGKARTRYMQDVCGGPEGYKKAFLEKLAQVKASGEEIVITPIETASDKQGDGSVISGKRIIEQKQDGLYTVIWHPLGGMPDVKSLCALRDAIQDMQDVEMRLAPDETAYIINLTGAEAQKVIDATPDSAQTLFETSVSCIGATTCQAGLRDSQGLLHACVEAVRAAGIPDGALPQINISGCPSSCGVHQTGVIGFRGHSKKVDGKMEPAFMMFMNGSPVQGQEKFGDEIGVVLEAQIPEMLVKIGSAAAAAGMDYKTYAAEQPEALQAIIAQYI